MASKYIIDHCFFPPVLPHQDDFDAGHQERLLNRIVEFLQLYDDSSTINVARGAINNIIKVHNSSAGSIDEAQLKVALRSLVDRDGPPIPLHVRAQNAAVLIQRQSDASITIELFELSPRNKSVYESTGRLIRTFPGSAVQLDSFSDDLQATIAATLSSMSKHRAPDMQPTARKGGRDHDEDRDTTHPGLVTELFLGFLHAQGKSISVSSIRKHTREEVMYANANLPFRRSPMWLMVRVTLQLIFARRAEHLSYKKVMLFLLSSILESSLEQADELDTDLLYFMSSKLTQRLRKLGASDDDSASRKARTAIAGANTIVSARWGSAQRADGRTLEPYVFDYDTASKDTDLSLPLLDDFVSRIQDREHSSGRAAFIPASDLITFEGQDLLNASTVRFGKEYRSQNLCAFELWVARDLQQAHAKHSGAEIVMLQTITRLMADYHSAASQQYRDNPEALSIMHLTMMELWVLCDQSALAVVPLLRVTMPILPINLLQSLLLPKREHMTRLDAIERYISARTENSTHRDDLEQTEFREQFFDESARHRFLLDDIIATANAAREKKVKAFHRDMAEHKRLTTQVAGMSCDISEVQVMIDGIPDVQTKHYSNACRKCVLARRAEGMTANPHEWPLPTSESAQKLVVFELEPPQAFSIWRDCTAFMLLDVLPGSYQVREMPRARYELTSNTDLDTSVHVAAQRIGMLSADKPHLATHRRVHLANATERDVTLSCGLRYQLFDSKQGVFLKQISHDGAKFDKTCTYRLPESMACLQKFIARSNGLDHNAVISSLDSVSASISLDEYRKLASVPCGANLRWHNMLVQIAAPSSLQFRKLGTALVFQQCMYQAGPRGLTLRKAHSVVEDPDFSSRYLGSLQCLLRSIEENWEYGQTLSLIIDASKRILTLTTTENIVRRSLDLLADARLTGMRWVDTLAASARHAKDDKTRNEYRSLAVDVAMICISSFDVDDAHLGRLLHAEGSAQTLYQFSLVLQNDYARITQSRSPETIMRSSRCRQTLYKASTCKNDNFFGLDAAVSKTWTGFQPTGPWRQCASASHWVMTYHKGDTPVHYNLLDGTLLVDGLPLDRLPQEYEQHPYYAKLFGTSTIEVALSQELGMCFEARHHYQEHQVSFGAFEMPHKDMLICAQRGGVTYNLVPARVFDGSIPTAFIADYLHWYARIDGQDVVQLSPLQTPWVRSSSLVFIRRKHSWQLECGNDVMLGLQGETARHIGRILKPLAAPSRIHIKLTNSILEIHLPTVRLHFEASAKDTRLYAKEFGMFVDLEQSLRTLIGFQNKLSLVSGMRKCVLLLHGPVCSRQQDGHVIVKVDNNRLNATVFALQVDTRLCRLTGSLKFGFYIAHLHALTSFALVDPFLHVTGTDAALVILRSAATLSTTTLTKDDIESLKGIMQLKPDAVLYPKHLREMVTQTWHSHVSWLSQYGGLRNAVTEIVAHVERMSLFYKGDSTQDLQESIDEPLLTRSLVRTSICRSSAYGAEDKSMGRDSTYSPRDRVSSKAPRYQNSRHWSTQIMTGSTAISNVSADALWSMVAAWPSLQAPGAPRSDQMPQIRFGPTLLSQTLGDSVGRHWFALQQELAGGRISTTDVAMFVSTLSCSRSALHNGLSRLEIRLLVLIHNCPEYSARITLPTVQSLRPTSGYNISYGTIQSCLEKHTRDFDFSPECTMVQLTTESCNDFIRRKNVQYKERRGIVLQGAAQALLDQWPTETPTWPQLATSMNLPAYLTDCLPSIRHLFKLYYDNRMLHIHLEAVAHFIGTMPEPGPPSSIALSFPDTAFPTDIKSAPSFVDLHSLLTSRSPSHSAMTSDEEEGVVLQHIQYPSGLKKSSPAHVTELLDRLPSGACGYEGSYNKQLAASLEAWSALPAQSRLDLSQQTLKTALDRYKSATDRDLGQITACIRRSLEQDEQDLHLSTWPRISAPITLLSLLNFAHKQSVPQTWRKCLVQYGIAITKSQRAERLLALLARRDHAGLLRDLENRGHTNWEPLSNPDSLLAEIESGIMIRPNQESVAQQMRDRTQGNHVLQFNMGEGKSSLIAPIVAASLADGTQIVRVVVAKPQSKQSTAMLLDKLGGLVHRRVYHLPVSRALQLNQSDIVMITKLCEECMVNGGVMLLLPENILSLKLMMIERCTDNESNVPEALTALQTFFDHKSRDIVDESDANFSVQFELVYTVGAQRQLELAPIRWQCIQSVLDIVFAEAPNIAVAVPDALYLARSATSGGIGITRILKAEAGDKLLTRVVERICDVGLDCFPLARQAKGIREQIAAYIRDPDINAELCSLVKDSNFWHDPTLRQVLLLLRGLFAGGVLAFCFGSKRYRVNYGLARTRLPATRLAVPYRAKDSPAPRSEYSQPEVILVLTSLSYYYAGLEDYEIFDTLQHLIIADEAEAKYQSMILAATDLPRSFRQLRGINLSDVAVCTTLIWPHLRLLKGFIDYFLANLVFPKEIKEFPSKLSASGWDLGRFALTGFSGTNDLRTVLPLNVSQSDVPAQTHTNAMVLEHVLNPENSIAYLPAQQIAMDERKTMREVDQLLQLLMSLVPPVQVLLDVGALILESNASVAARWLELHPDPRYEAAVFVDDEDNICVLTRSGVVENLRSSSYSARLGSCLVFLDESHTRGIDLRLPRDYRAAVTLGAKLTKDRVVQACMRMRELATGQTLCVLIPDEIKDKIATCTKQREAGGTRLEEAIDMVDVLHWTISETREELRRSMPLWSAQGLRFLGQDAMYTVEQTGGANRMAAQSALKFLEPEARSLADRYQPTHNKADFFTPIDLARYPQLTAIRHRCQQFENLSFDSAALQEEQERELCPEMEIERQVERPRARTPEAHVFHPDILAFVSKGVMKDKTDAYTACFESLRNTKLGRSFPINLLNLGGNSDVLTSADFAKTVKRGSHDSDLDQYQRHIQWIVTKSDQNHVIERMLIVSPFEASEIKERIAQGERHKLIHLHVYTPRWSREYDTLDRLDLYVQPKPHMTLSVPQRLQIQLNLFAGQTYFDSFEMYQATCAYLGLTSEAAKDCCKLALDGFILEDANGFVGGPYSRLQTSPVAFLRGLMTHIRRDGEAIEKSHMGQMLGGRILTKSDFE